MPKPTKRYLWIPIPPRVTHEFSAAEVYGTLDKPLVIGFRVSPTTDLTELYKATGRIVQVQGFRVVAGRGQLILGPCPKGIVAESGVVEPENEQARKGTDDGTMETG